LLPVGEVAREVLDSIQSQPDASIRDLDVAHDLRHGELALQAQRRLALVRGERRDVDQPGHAVVDARGGDPGPGAASSDEDGWARHPPERALDRFDIALERLEGVLRRYHLVPVRLQSRDQLAEARAVGP